MRQRILFLLLALPLWCTGQITLTNGSFSNGSGMGTDGTFTVTSLVGSSGALPNTTIATSPADSLALVDFYNAMNGPSWTIKSNWLASNKALNTWFGVTVGSNGRVIGLSLPNNQVAGGYPNSFVTLSALQTLDLSKNPGVDLPNNINQFTALTSVNFAASDIFDLPSFTGLNHLTSLILHSNYLTFDDLEPVASIPGIIYSPQNPFGGGSTSYIMNGNPWNNQLKAAGTANQYQWFKGGSPVGGSTSDTYLIPSVSGGDAGIYTLNVTDALVPGLTLSSQDLTLTVVSPGPQTYFTWPQNDGIINDVASDSYGGYFADIDNDGDEDLAVSNLQSAVSGRSVDLYENNGGTFTRLQSANMPTDEGPRDITWSDYDNDGDLDFFVGDVGFNLNTDKKGAFYRNEGNKTFTRVPLDQIADGAAWADYDNDGRVDLFTYAGGDVSTVYKNMGNGSFTLAPVTFTNGAYWTLAFADIDSDRDLDLVQLGRSDGTSLNSLYRNDGNGVYTFMAASPISTDNLGNSRGGSWADIDNDGDMDFFAMNTQGGGNIQSAFYFNDGAGNFSRQTSTAVLGADVRGRASSFGDVDNDGDVDLVVSNGRPGNVGTNLYLNNGNGTFVQATSSVQSFIPLANTTLAQLTLGDANNDGFLDLFAATFNPGQPPALYRNTGNNNKWIKFKLQGSVSNRSGVGARIEILAGGNKQIREVTTQTGLASQNSLVQHFGLKNSTQVDQVTVHWPSGINQTLSNISANQVLTIIESASQPPPQMQISFTANNVPVPNNHPALYNIDYNTLTVGSHFDLPYHILNAGGSPLTINTVALSGTNAADFQTDLSSLPATVAPGATLDFVVSFVPTAVGPRSAIISVSSNDPDDSPYEFSLSGTGLSPIQAPTIPASNISFTNVFSTQLQINFTKGNGAKRLVVMNPGTPIGFAPVDDTFYTLGDTGSGNQIVANSDVSSVSLSDLLPGTTYYFVVYEFNELGNLSRYLTIGPAKSFVATAALPNVYVTTPPDFSSNQNVTLNVTSSALPGASTYTIELNDKDDFTGNSFIKSGGRTQAFSGLMYGAKYFTRVKTNLSPDYGRSTTFKTSIPDIVVTAPADGAINQNLTVNVTATAVTGATLYTVELNDRVDFTGTAIVQTGARTQAFTGLKYATVYYTRVKTNNYPVFGRSTSFRTLIPNVVVSSPVNGATNQNITLNVTASALTGATSYTIELNDAADFSGNDFLQTGGRTQAFTGLKYNTQYYTRVKTDVYPFFGSSSSFTTATAESFAYITSPANAAVNVNFNINVTANLVAGANSYTIELNTAPDFTGISFVQTGSGRTYLFHLHGSVTYYSRVMTDLSSNWGPVRSFTTRSAAALTYVTTPANNATNALWDLQVTATNIGGASLYTIELNDADDFTGTSFVVSGATNRLHFTGLSFNTTYFSRVQTDLEPAWGPTRQFTTSTPLDYTFVTTPINGAANVNVSVGVTANLVTAATQYTIELNTASDFTGTSIVHSGPGRTFTFSGLVPSKTYYNRVKTDLLPNDWGSIRSFSTKTGASFAFVTSPANNAVNVLWNVDVVSNIVPTAVSYTIELNTSGDFTGDAIVQTSASNRIHFNGLAYNTAYYSRVMTDVDPTWGATREFLTGSPVDYAYITSPADGASNVNWVSNLTSNTVPSATFYTIEANTSSDFLGTSIVKSGAKTQNFVLAKDQTYYVRVKTELSAMWGAAKSFTTGNALSLAYITSPADNSTGVPTTVNVVANALPGATQYTIQLTSPAGTVTKSSASRTINFSGLIESTTYVARVSSSLTPGLWGPVRTFTTINPAGRSSSDWIGEIESDSLVVETAMVVSTYPNPFADRLEVLAASPDQIPIRALLYDLDGKVIFESNDWMTNRMEVISGEFSPGIYLLQLQAGDTRQVIRVMRR